MLSSGQQPVVLFTVNLGFGEWWNRRRPSVEPHGLGPMLGWVRRRGQEGREAEAGVAPAKGQSGRRGAWRAFKPEDEWQRDVGSGEVGE